jgi:hypothetical protein
MIYKTPNAQHSIYKIGVKVVNSKAVARFKFVAV